MAKYLDYKTICEMMENMLTGVAFLAFQEDRMELLYVNDGGFRMLGYSRELGMKYVSNLVSVILDEDKPKFWQAIEDVLKDDGAVDIEIRTVTATGSLRWLQIRGNLYEKTKDRAVILCIFMDATDRKFVENEIRMQSEWYQMLLETEGEILLDYNAKTDVLAVKTASEYGLESNKLIDRFFVKIKEQGAVDPESRRIAEIMEEGLKIPRVDIIEVNMRLKEGMDKRWYRIHTSSIAGVDGYVTHIVGKITDIHEKRLLLEELRDKGKLDDLTGWCNAIEAKTQIEQAMASSDKDSVHAFILVDLSSFRILREMLGEETSNRVLKDITQKMGKDLNRSDILGRLGGDEFILFVQNVGGVSNLDALASRIARCTEVTLGSGEDSFVLAGCVGVSVYPYQGNTWSDLYEKADLAMNTLRADGKDGYHIFDLSGVYKSELAGNERPNQNFYDEINSGVDLEELLGQFLRENKYNISQLRAVLKIVIRHYGFHRAYLSMEGTAENPGLEYQYSNPGYGQKGDGSDGHRWITFLKLMNLLEDGMRVIHNYDNIPEALSSYMIRNRLHTMLIQPLMTRGEVTGVFIMGECKGREWNPSRNEEKELKRILQLIQLYMLRYERQQNGQKTLTSLRMLDDFDSYVMAIDYDTYELCFANRKLLDALPDLQIGDCCYHTYAKQDKPCEGCVMRKLERKDSHAKCSEERFSPSLRSWLKTHVSWLENDADIATCIVNCMDISEYFMGMDTEKNNGFDWQRYF